MGEITYTKRADYLIPYLTLPTEPELPLTAGRLNGHLYQTEQTALQRLELLTKQLAAEQGVTEELKENAPMQWLGMMNNIRSQAEETILSELIYN